MNYSINHIVHLFSVFILVGVAFAAFAAPNPERRKMYMSISGICSLIVLVTGFGMLGVLKLGVPLWAIVKVVCWIILSGVAGVAIKKKENIKAYIVVTLLALLTAITMVSLKPF